MEVFSFYTIQEPADSQYKEKGSKFIGFVYPVQTEEEVKARIQELKKKYFDARHHCFAYILGPDKLRFRAFDDGEPNHSAGDPILGQIRSKNLTDVLVVVIRYFGGVKLGVGGLISAYKTAAEEALNNALIIEKEVTRELILEYSYEATPDVMKLVKDFELEITNQKFETSCVLQARVKERMKNAFIEKYTLLNALGSKLNLLWAAK